MKRLLRVKAYILAADPAWIEPSILSFYDYVDELLVVFDENYRGFTGRPVPVEECLGRLRSIDVDRKIRLLPVPSARPVVSPMDNEVRHRQCALEELDGTADWILQLDTDEILPRPSALIDALELADEMGMRVVEWPMRVFFQRLGDGRFLEVCTPARTDHFEYPGPVAIRSDVRPVHGRRAHGPFVRVVSKGDVSSLQVSRAQEEGEVRVEACDSSDAILHLSWSRTSAEMKLKLRSWAHASGVRSWLYYYRYWKSAPYVWRSHRDFHPFARGLWPALKPSTVLTPSSLSAFSHPPKDRAACALTNAST